MKPKLIIVGGFLGSGKTTLLLEASKRLTNKGYSVGLITNDQVSNLVDTRFLSNYNHNVTEVIGSCFCCNFNGFIKAVDSLIAKGAEIIFAEPVGSCTDLSATILQPLKDKYSHIELAPFTVLVDPLRVRMATKEGDNLYHEDVIYIFKLQMEEADYLVLNKIDIIKDEEKKQIMDMLKKIFPEVKIKALSAINGEGVDDWIDTIMSDKRSGLKIVNVDYDKYARGEAFLGWCNALISLEGDDVNWGKFTEDFMIQLQETFNRKKAEIAHIKMLIMDPDNRIGIANVTSLESKITSRDFESVKGNKVSAIFNARVQISPIELGEIITAQIRSVCKIYKIKKIDVLSLHCLMPGRPTPTWRYSSIV